MTDESPLSEATLSEELRQRFAGDIAAGRTIALPAADLARADLRAHLPEVLESLMLPGSEATRLQIPDYTVLGEIGHGGMSTVYLASHNKLRRYVALKIVPNWLGGQDRARERMLKEAQAMARVAHPNIVTIHDIIDTGDTVAIAMEWIDGLTLAGLLRTLPDKPTPDDMVVLRTSLGTPQGFPNQLEATTTRTFARMMADIARAVHCVHQNGLLHLDIKPSNVLVRRNGTPLLADFGVVREMDLALTHTRSFAGTPIYAAPEQLRREDAAFGARTDVYGLGITLYELIARVQPLRQESLTRVLQDIQAGRIPPLSSHAEVPHDLENIVHKAISPELSKRYATAQALADDLQAFLDGRAVVARPLSRPERIGRWVRAEPWKAMLAVILMITLPAVAFLGARVWLDRPIKEAQLRDVMDKRHDTYVHEGFQSFLVTADVEDHHLEHLRTAIEENPASEDALACLLTMEGVADPSAASRRIRALGNRQTPGTTLLAKRLEENRPYFDAEEIQDLRRSSRRVDKLLLIMDEILKGTQTGDAGCFLDAAKELEQANTTPDALLQGLRVWVAVQNEDEAGFSQSIYFIKHTWPHDLHAHAWAMFALDRKDPQRARQVIEDFLVVNPEHLGALVLIAQNYLMSGDPETALEVLDRPSQPDDRWNASAKGTRISALGYLNRRDEAKALMPGPFEELAKNPFWLECLQRVEPDKAKEFYRHLVQDQQVTMATLLSALRLAKETQDATMIEEVATIGHRRFPTHAEFRWTLARLCVETKKYERAIALVGDTLPTPGNVADFGLYAAILLKYDRQWDKMLALCDIWARKSPENYRLEYYHGLALSRLGRHAEAVTHLNRHIQILKETPPANSRIAGPYTEVYAELGWCTLAERRANPTHVSDDQIGQYVALLTDSRLVRQNAWLSLVVAELEGALNHRTKAQQWASQAKELLGKNDLGAPANIAQMVDDAIARFK